MAAPEVEPGLESRSAVATFPFTAQALCSGELSPSTMLDRLEEAFAQREERVHSFVAEPERFTRLRRQVAELEARFADPASRPPLFGVPVGIKDLIHVDGLPTRAGSAFPPELLAGDEAPAVRALRRAGALILGKTVATEFAAFAPGPTRNPHALEHTPGGSSSGSAAAVAAGLTPLALGTQTIGSIGRPAAFCGVVGFKPSYDRVSRDGVIPLAPSFDHVGPLAASVDWAARAVRVLLGEGRATRWRAAEESDRRPVLAIPTGPYLDRAEEVALRCLEESARRLRSAGYEVREVARFPDFVEVEARHRRIFEGEMARVHADWLADHRELYRPQTLEILLRGTGVTEAQLEVDLPRCRALREELETRMEEGGIDLWLAPGAAGPAPPGLESTGDPVMSLPWTQAGLPALTLPAGRDPRGLPLGVQLVGRLGADEELLAWGAAIEELVA